MKVVSFYRFVDIGAPGLLRERMAALCEDHGLLGTVLVAGEGVNGTLAGSAAAVQAVLDWLHTELGSGLPLEGRWTEAAQAPFERLRVRQKPEIVTLGRPDIRPQQRTGTHLSPRQWDALLGQPETLVIDTRNHYEVEVGTFRRAVDPGTDSFRQFPGFAQELAAASTDRPLAMFCTGGIRCEKATALMLELGFSEVYQLQGGILNYLEQTEGEDSLWEGECFVFDKRVAVDCDLACGGYVQCHACRRPLSAEDLQAPEYREGVSCPRCAGELDPQRAASLEERRRQIALARERGGSHLGAVVK
ncbi:MAG: rhodanese-related sulfurtransferase [Gammaproteobacteria bacterium]|nr:MAG: rhodanese-related sulfurtransferase [Gammaproteobacteria bacterium]